MKTYFSNRRAAVRIGRILLLVLASSLVVLTAQAQNYKSLEAPNSNIAYFFHAQPGEATVQISLWGTIPRPGIYEVREQTELDKLLTMAGGVPLGASGENQTAHVTVQVFRQQVPGERMRIYSASLEELLSNTAEYPTLQNEDVVVVRTTVEEEISWRSALTVMGSIAAVALTIERLVTRLYY